MGITLKELRNKTGLSQKQFAERFGIPLSTLRKWEQGESRPADYVIQMLADRIPGPDAGIKVIKCHNGEKYYYNELLRTISDSTGVKIVIHTDLNGVKEENLPLYVKDLFESYYYILEKFDRDCTYDKSDGIIWS